MRARNRDDADIREMGREAADRVGGQDPLRDASVERQRSDRDGERRQSNAGDEKPVERTEQHADDDRRTHRGPDRPAVLEQLGHQDGAEAEHRRDRQIDLAGDDDQGQRQRHDRDLADVQADVEEIGRLEEVRGNAGAESDRAAKQDQQKRLPTDDETETLPPRRTAAGLVTRLVVVELSHDLSSWCAGPVRHARRSAGRRRSPQ